MSRAGRARAAREAEEIVRRARRPRGRELKAEWECGMTWSGGERQRAAAHLAPDTKHPGKHHKFDLFKSLHQLYDELCREESLHNTYQGLKTTSYLLEKLLARVNLNTLIINLYPGNKGYSLSLKVNGSTQELFPSDVNEEETVETARWPYEEEELLSHIDNEELPVVLLDLLEADHSSLFYSGCVVAQVRDFRQAYPNFLCDTHHVLLRPTNQSILRDCAGVTGRCGLGGEERAALEAALVLATAPPLCLDPRPALGLLAARLHSAPRLLNTPRIRRQARRFSQVSVNRKRKLEAWSRAHGLELLELVGRQRARQPGRHPAAHHRAAHHDRLTSKYPKRPPDVLKGVEGPRVECPVLGAPSEPGAALRLARAYERGRVSQDCAAQLVEEYVLETERAGGGGVFHIKLSILQRPSDQEFLGELYVDRDHVDGERNGAACRFTLGSRVHANKYIQQFTEIFTEEGRKSVRIKHAVPGQPSRITFTPACREQTQQLVLQQRPGSAVSAPAPAPSPGSAPVPSPPVVTSSAGAGVGAGAAAGAVATARSLPILQAQLAGGVGAGAGAGAAVDMQQPSPGQAAHRHSPQVGAGSAVELPGGAGAGGGGGGANQLLAAQLTNPPQPLNPSKLPASAVLHIQHPAATHRLITSTQAGGAGVTAARPRTTNPAISALVTSLMNSAHQFQQQANQNAGKPVASSVCGNNATILNLLNSAPAAMTHPTTVASDNYTRHQVLSGYGAGGAGEEAGGEASLLERLMSGGGGEAGEPEAAPAPAPAPAPPQALQLQGLSLASLQGLGVGVGVQNVQVQIPGLAAPISLSLNVSGAGGGLLVSVPPTTSVVLHNQPSVLSLPIAQLMSSGVKGGVRGGVQLVRARAPAAPQPRPLRPLAAPLLAAAPAAAAASAAPLQTAAAAGGGGAQFLTQAQQQTLAQQLRRKPSTDGPQQQ